MRPPKEVYYVDAKFTKPTYMARAGVKGGRVAAIEHALDRRTAILDFDPDATVKIWRSQSTWVEIQIEDGPRAVEDV